jgi:hypothetical protein
MNNVAILLEPDGEVTTPDFAGLAEPNHPGGRLWHVRVLIDSAVPEGAAVPNSADLVVWTDGHAHYRRRSVNLIGSVVVADAFELPLQVVCGPVLITGGSAEAPRALTAAQLAEAFEFLGLEPISTQVEG